MATPTTTITRSPLGTAQSGSPASSTSWSAWPAWRWTPPSGRSSSPRSSGGHWSSCRSSTSTAGTASKPTEPPSRAIRPTGSVATDSRRRQLIEWPRAPECRLARTPRRSTHGGRDGNLSLRGWALVRHAEPGCLVLRFLARRLILLLPVVWGISVFAFLLLYLVPGNVVDILLGADVGDPARGAELRELFGLDRPVTTRYVEWLSAVARGDLGRSLVTRRPVLTEIGTRHFR